jgi:hypothetical protein
MTKVFIKNGELWCRGENDKVFIDNYTRMNSHTIHAWVERDGKIIDNLFGEFDGREVVYSRVNKKLQKIFETLIIRPFLDYDYSMYEPTDGFCNLNCIHEIKKNGGTIVFGSLGYRENGTVTYVWGNPKFKTYQEFVTLKA